MTQQVKSNLQRWVYVLTVTSTVLGLASIGALFYYKQHTKKHQ